VLFFVFGFFAVFFLCAILISLADINYKPHSPAHRLMLLGRVG